MGRDNRYSAYSVPSLLSFNFLRLPYIYSSPPSSYIAIVICIISTSSKLLHGSFLYIIFFLSANVESCVLFVCSLFGVACLCLFVLVSSRLFVVRSYSFAFGPFSFVVCPCSFVLHPCLFCFFDRPVSLLVCFHCAILYIMDGLLLSSFPFVQLPLLSCSFVLCPSLALSCSLVCALGRSPACKHARLLLRLCKEI